MVHARLAATLPLLALLALPVPSVADDASEIQKAEDAVALFRKTDPSIGKFLETSSGWAVFPSVVKGAIGIGGAGGKGVLFEKGKAIGTTSVGQITIGLALGGQEYAEIIFFENALALSSFKEGNFALAAQVSAVAAASGAAATAKYQQGVAVFTVAIGGLMYEASVGGQKFGFTPFAEKKEK
jgi:lipid-binding SYLF domain-containing protein